MAGLSCNSIAAKCTVFASLHVNSPPSPQSNDPPSPQSHNTGPNEPRIPTTKTRRTKSLPKKRSQVLDKLQQKYTFIKLERAIGAGSYRDSEPNGGERRHSVLQGLLPNSDDMKETVAEKKMRETGQWLVDNTEEGFRSNGRKMLMFSFWGIPIYIFLFMVAAGVIQLPFSSPLLEDLLM
ncbi:hypothetical protein Tsubulata_026677 [Turnera subulata]|uniref:NAD(P)H dehydrogenase subunit CRR3, chloroplastic n=1 Tax=Turnera subulata TaxID=218843 RepID=A0A9Q0FPB8_9ROSI|nr:hypothetical protein Tsubulata_026677 [Turnera subulata]